jgi:hypothetical protein
MTFYKTMLMAAASICVAMIAAYAQEAASVPPPETQAEAVEEGPGLAQTSRESTPIIQSGPAQRVLSQSAANYATYQSAVSDVKKSPFRSADDIAATLTDLGGHSPEQLSSGWIAYSALVASEDPGFRAAVRDIEGFYGEDDLLLGLRNDIRYARTLEGGNSAVSAALTAIEADARRVKGAGALVKEQAYTLQAAGWAKARLRNPESLISKLETGARAGKPASPGMISALRGPKLERALAAAGRGGAASIWEGLTDATSAIRVPAIPVGYSGRTTRIRRGQEPIADRIATLAAYRILDAEAAPASQVRSAMTERKSKACLNMAQLNLQQCVAAAHKNYEVPFCIGEHALTEIGSCIDGAAQ